MQITIDFLCNIKERKPSCEACIGKRRRRIKELYLKEIELKFIDMYFKRYIKKLSNNIFRDLLFCDHNMYFCICDIFQYSFIQKMNKFSI